MDFRLHYVIQFVGLCERARALQSLHSSLNCVPTVAEQITSTNSIKLHSYASASKPYATRKVLFFSCCRGCSFLHLSRFLHSSSLLLLLLLLLCCRLALARWRRQFSIFMPMQYYFLSLCRKIETHRQFRCIVLGQCMQWALVGHTGPIISCPISTLSLSRSRAFQSGQF